MIFAIDKNVSKLYVMVLMSFECESIRSHHFTN